MYNSNSKYYISNRSAFTVLTNTQDRIRGRTDRNWSFWIYETSARMFLFKTTNSKFAWMLLFFPYKKVKIFIKIKRLIERTGFPVYCGTWVQWFRFSFCSCHEVNWSLATLWFTQTFVKNLHSFPGIHTARTCTLTSRRLPPAGGYNYSLSHAV